MLCLKCASYNGLMCVRLSHNGVKVCIILGSLGRSFVVLCQENFKNVSVGMSKKLSNNSALKPSEKI